MKTIAFTSLFFLWIFPLFAQNWTGTVSSDWDDIANWSSPPVDGCEITIDLANYTGVMAHPAVVGESGFSPAKIHILNGAKLYVSGEMVVSDTIEVSGAGSRIIMNSGEFPAWSSTAKMIFSDDANLLALNGTMHIRRLELRTGASATINSVQMTMWELILADGSATAPSRLIQNGGSVSVSNTVVFKNELGDFNPAYIQHAGELQIWGTLQYVAQLPGAGTGILRSTGENSSVFVGDTLGSDPAGTMRMHLSVDSSAQMLFTGPEVRLAPGDSIRMGENTVWTDYTTTWINDGVFYAVPSSEFRAGTTTLTGTGHYQFGSLAIQGIPQHLYHVSPQKIYISGDFISGYNHFHPGTNRVVLNGSLSQQNNIFYPEINFYDLEITNTFNGTNPAVTMDGDVRIAHELALVDGVARLTATTTVQIADDATINGGSENCFIDGYMEKTGNEACLFPVGKAPDFYRPLSIEAPVNASTVVRVGYKRQAHIPATPVEAPLFAASMIEYWDLSRTGSNDQLIPAVGWNDAEQSGLINCGQVELAVWNGSLWNAVPATITGPCGGNDAGSLTAQAALPQVGPLTIGFTTPVYQQIVSLCNSTEYTVGTNTYTTAGIYYDTLQTVGGQDSIVMSILTFPAWLPAVILYTFPTHLAVVSQPPVSSVQWLDCNNNFAPLPGETNTYLHPTQNGSYAALVSHVGCTDSDTSECLVISVIGIAETDLPPLILFPNPLKAGQELQLTGVLTDESFAILGIDGRVIRTVLAAPSGENTVIPVGTLAPGNYWLTGTSMTGSYLYRFTVID
jgi:hypothetical protein